MRPLHGGESHGATTKETRAAIETKMFDIPEDAAWTERPLYGYLEGSDESGALREYGEIVLGLGDELRPNTSFVLGDTLDSTVGAPVFMPVPLLRPSIDAVSNSKDGTWGAQSLAHACAGHHRYAEIQIRGGVKVSQIARVVYTAGVQPSSEARELLHEAGVNPQCVTGHDPGPKP